MSESGGRANIVMASEKEPPWWRTEATSDNWALRRESPSSLLPMLISGLVLIVIGSDRRRDFYLTISGQPYPRLAYREARHIEPMAEIQFEGSAIVVDAEVIGKALGIDRLLVQQFMREGKITSLSERAGSGNLHRTISGISA